MDKNELTIPHEVAISKISKMPVTDWKIDINVFNSFIHVGV